MTEPTPDQRLTALEEKVEYLLSIVSTPAVLQIPDTDPDDTERIREQLNATMIRVERDEDPSEGDTGWGQISTARQNASQRAQTQQAIPLPDNFNPGIMGYTGHDWVKDFPGVDAHTVLSSFISHHKSKGDVSKNWMEKFFSYATNAVRIEKERRQSQPTVRDTDSMGLPLDRGARIRAKRAEMENHQQRIDAENREKEVTE